MLLSCHQPVPGRGSPRMQCIFPSIADLSGCVQGNRGSSRRLIFLLNTVDEKIHQFIMSVKLIPTYIPLSLRCTRKVACTRVYIVPKH